MSPYGSERLNQYFALILLFLEIQAVEGSPLKDCLKRYAYFFTNEFAPKVTIKTWYQMFSEKYDVPLPTSTRRVAEDKRTVI